MICHPLHANKYYKCGYLFILHVHVIILAKKYINTTSFTQGKRLNYAFNYASSLWGSLAPKQKLEEEKLHELLQQRKQLQQEREQKLRQQLVEEKRRVERAKRERKERVVSRTVSWHSSPSRRSQRQSSRNDAHVQSPLTCTMVRALFHKVAIVYWFIVALTSIIVV